MVSIFKHKEKQKQHRNNVLQERVATNITNKIIRIQQQWALTMQRLTERLSRTAKKIALTAFCFFSGSYSIYLMTGRFTTQQGKSLSITTLQLPGYPRKTPDYRIRNYAAVTAAEYLKIKRFIRYMDSLSESSRGKNVADSIRKSSPGLKDSIALIEKRYQLQSLKK